MKSIVKIIFTAASLALLMSFQIINTSLNVTVLNGLGNPEPGAKVQLFENEKDYREEKNVALEGITDKKGVLKFKEIKAISYYVIVRKDDKDNSDGAEQIGKLESGRINKATIIIQ